MVEEERGENHAPGGCDGDEGAVGSFGGRGEDLVGEDALEFASWIASGALEAAAQGCGEGAPFDLPKFFDLNAQRVELACRAHGTKQGCPAFGCPDNEFGFIGNGVYGVDNVIVAPEVEFVGVFGREPAVYGGNPGVGIDFEQAAAHDVDFRLAEGL